LEAVHMKFLTGFLTLLFFTTVLQAQMPYAGSNLQPYYPGATTQPYYPQAYYPQPGYVQEPAYVQQPAYVRGPYAPIQVPVAGNGAEVDILSRQVEQLSDQLRQVEAQLTLRQRQTAAREGEATSAEPATAATLVFRNGKIVHAQGYVIAGRTLWILDPSGSSQRVAVEQLDVPATQAENRRNGIRFPDLGTATP